MDRRTMTVTMLGLVATLTTAAAAQAQGRGPQRVPPGHLPPAGMCRVWYDNVPPGRQPAPTSCRDAERSAGRNARVIYGDRRDADRRADRRDDRRDDRWYDRRDDRRDDRSDDRWYDRSGSRPDARVESGRGRTGEVRGRVGGNTGTPCVDRNRDGYCDSVGGRNLPLMSRTSTLTRDQRTAVERQWLGDARMAARYTDRDRNGVPEEILWYDQRGQLLQRWQDSNRDGRADEVAFYRDGRVSNVVR